MEQPRTLLTLPNSREVISTRMQTDPNKPTFTQTTQQLIRESKLFSGYAFNVVLCWNPAIQNTCFDRLKAAILKQRTAAAGGLEKVHARSPVSQ